MTERKQALQELRDKVVAREVHGRCLPAQVAFGPLAKLAWAAQDGSLDAAKALHEAVLPGYNVGLMNRVQTGGWCALVYPLGPKSADWVSSADPARAWLIAILDALIAEADNG